MPLDDSVTFRACGLSPSGWGDGLLALYESACHDRVDVFEQRAVALLERLIGFDGAVWGRGSPVPGGPGVQIDTATVLDRDERLLHDYAATGEADPVARRFFGRPDSVQAVSVADFYRGRGRERIGDCLAAHDVAHVLLAGGRDAGPAGGGERYSWLTAYRREAGAPFDAAEAERYAALLPHWVRAREVCAELARAREPAPAAAPVRPAPRPASPRVSCGSSALSQREAEVLVFVSRGYTYVEAAALMGISRSTVHSHVRNLYGKLGVHTKTEAVFEARALGWLD